MAKVICTCKHEQQDAMHGKQVRVANLMAVKDPKSNDRQVRCTVCSTVHRVTLSNVK